MHNAVNMLKTLRSTLYVSGYLNKDVIKKKKKQMKT